MKLIRKITKLINNHLVSKYGYQVVSIEYKALHSVWSFKEALEWMQCYDEDDKIIVRKNHKLVAMRSYCA